MYNSCNQHTPKTKGSIRWRPPLHSLQSDCPQDHLNLHIHAYHLLVTPSFYRFVTASYTMCPWFSCLLSNAIPFSLHPYVFYSWLLHPFISWLLHNDKFSLKYSTTCYYSIMYLCVVPPQSCLLLVFPNFFFSSSCVLILLYYILPVTKHSYVVSPCYSFPLYCILWFHHLPFSSFTSALLICFSYLLCMFLLPIAISTASSCS